MKNFLLSLLLLWGSYAFSQTDVIYPAEGGTIIENCEIREIKDGNVVYYLKNFKESHIVALAISQDGVYIPLSAGNRNDSYAVAPVARNNGMGNDYEYYRRLRSGALAKRNVGIVFTFVGIGAAVAGSLMLMENESVDEATALYIGGEVLANVGVILWISGGIKAANNRKAMNRARMASGLSFGPTQHGVGFRLSIN